jgi:hypothetical protein
LAGQVNQYLVSHAATFVQAGTRQAAQTTVGSGFASSVNQWIAQSFTTSASQTATGYVTVTASATGTPPPWTFSIQASSSGTPSGAPLVSAPVPHEFVPSPSGLVTVILPVSGLSPSVTYWIVASSSGDVSDNFAWYKSNQVSGAATSTDGSSWSPQSFGMLYQVFDGSLTPPLTGVWEDSGARWTLYGYSSNRVSSVREFTTGQTAGGYAASVRGLSYSGGLLTGVA